MNIENYDLIIAISLILNIILGYRLISTRCKHCNCKKRKVAKITYKRDPKKQEILDREITNYWGSTHTTAENKK